jgi:serine/threonine protein kinase
VAGVTTGEVLGGRYLLERLLGSGGMAEVYAATDRLLERPVAVKVLRERVGDPSSRARFTAEARTVAQLSHPHLVAVLDASTETDPAYLVLELVEGPSLAEVLPDPLPPEDVSRIGAQVADALAHAHAAGVVHRDIKPGNILLGSDGRARLTDFGVARLLADTTRHTATGLTLGTPAYLAPEQVRGSDVTPAADIYALGLVLLETLTGARVFTGTITEAVAARLHDSPPVPAQLPAEWREALTQMTRLHPHERPSAAQVTAVLHRLGGSTQQLDAATPAVDDGRDTQVLTTVKSAPAMPTGTATATAPVEPASLGRASITSRVARGASTKAALALGAVALVTAGVLALTTSGGDDRDGSGQSVPAEVPARYREPLTDLHNAVEGEAP